MYKNKNKKYKKYNRNVNQNVKSINKEKYIQENIQHFNNILAAIDNYSNFAKEVRKLNNKKLTSCVDGCLNESIKLVCDILTH